MTNVIFRYMQGNSRKRAAAAMPSKKARKRQPQPKHSEGGQAEPQPLTSGYRERLHGNTFAARHLQHALEELERVTHGVRFALELWLKSQ